MLMIISEINLIHEMINLISKNQSWSKIILTKQGRSYEGFFISITSY
jgi:hypothetical protein